MNEASCFFVGFMLGAFVLLILSAILRIRRAVTEDREDKSGTVGADSRAERAGEIGRQNAERAGRLNKEAEAASGDIQDIIDSIRDSHRSNNSL